MLRLEAREACAMFMFEFDHMLSEFYECFQKMKNTMEMCMMCWQFCQNSLNFSKPNKLLYSFHFLNSLLIPDIHSAGEMGPT